jgi:Calcineurin-like phosphoesterase/Purple acid Phosphatase, N-terminal domain
MARSRRVLRLRLVAATAGLLLLGIVLAPPSAGTAKTLRRFPYLTDLVRRHVTLNWATTTSIGRGHVRYGLARHGCRGHTVKAHPERISVGTTTERQWRASLDGLTPGARYCYRIYGDGLDLLGSRRAPRFFAQLARRSAKPFTFAVLGDWGSVGADGKNPDQAAVLHQLAISNARFVVMTGDTGYPGGSQRNYGDLVHKGADTSAVFGPAFWPRVGDSIPAFVAVGNHGLNRTILVNWPEHHAIASSEGTYRMQRYCCVNGTGAHDYPSAWYAFNAGKARFYVLDAAWPNGNIGHGSMYANDYASHWASTRPEYRWLKHDLARHHRRISFAFFHFPLYSDNPSETSDAYLNGPLGLEGLLGRNGVDIVFNGHAHIYQRNSPSSSGMPVTYVTGGGGGRLQSVSGCDANDRYAVGWTFASMHGTACGAAPVPTAADRVFHFLLVRVDGSSVTVTAVDEQGRTFDPQTYHP